MTEENKFTLLRACALNTLNMFGTGPFVSLPFLITSVKPAGPQALIGYCLAAVACISDSFIWSELGTLYPESGGSYIYLKKCYKGTIGDKLIPFLFVWQQIFSGPMEIATGFTAMARYLSYVTPMGYVEQSLCASIGAIITMYTLNRDSDTIGFITVMLWIGTVISIILTIGMGVSVFSPEVFQQADMFSPTISIISIGASMRFSMYDLMGYYDVCFIGSQIAKPTITIPLACIGTCICVAIIFIAVDVVVLGSFPLEGPDSIISMVENNNPNMNCIMSVFAEMHFGSSCAVLFTILIVYTIIGSSYSLMLGYAYVPYAAAVDGVFYNIFSHVNPRFPSVPDYSLLLTGCLTVFFCWFELEIVINGLVTTRLLVQFLAQSIGLLFSRPTLQKRPYSMPCYPFPCVLQIILFSLALITSESYFLRGSTAPVLEGSVLVLVSGVAAFFLQSNPPKRACYEV